MMYKINGLNRYLSYKTIKKELSKNKELLNTVYKVKYIKEKNYCLIVTENPLPSQLQIKNKFYEVKEFNDTHIKHSKNENSTDITSTISDFDIRDSVTPLWKMNYDDQIKSKKREIEDFYKKDVSYFKTTQFFRNSFQFCFGKDSENNACLGFKGPRFSHNISNLNLVFPIKECLNVSDILKKKISDIIDIFKSFCDFIYDRISGSGFLRQLMVRESSNEIISLVQIQDDNDDFKNWFLAENFNCENDINNFKQENKVDQNNKGNDINEYSLSCNDNTKKNSNLDIEADLNSDSTFEKEKLTENQQETKKDKDLNTNKYKKLIDLIQKFPFENIYISFFKGKHEGFIPTETYKIRGKDYLYEKINNYKFKVSFFSFFQNNTEITNEICKQICEKITRENVLYDLCCGSGMFSILLNKYFKEVVGIEINKESIKDALHNIEINNILNINVKEGNVENEIFEKNGTVILDPPRCGVSKKTICNIRKNRGINEIFYISCDFKKSFQNIVDLQREESNKYLNSGFEVVDVMGFDMFPNTNKSEVLIHLKRKKEKEEE